MPYAVCFSHNGDAFTRHETCETGPSAAERLKTMQRSYTVAEGYRWKIQKLRDDGLPEDWAEREVERFRNDTYEPTPWHDTDWYKAKHGEHFCHLSLKQPGKIAYTEDSTKGAADRQTIISPGRYLKKHFSDVLDANEIERWTAEVSVAANTCSLKITQDADEIETVYVNGPESCMSPDADDFSGPCHPVRVYAGPDLALAYLGDINDATARAVVWPEMKRHGRLYGDCSRLRLMLQQAGYAQGSLESARIQRIPCRSGFVMPYVDHIAWADDEGDFLRLGSGDLDTEVTTGITDEDSGHRCEHCGDRYNPDHGGAYVEGRGGGNWCDDCLGNSAVHCDYHEEYYSTNHYEFITVTSVSAAWGGGVIQGEVTIRADLAAEYEAVERVEGEWFTHNTLAFFDALTDIARYCRDLIEQPSLPLAA